MDLVITDIQVLCIIVCAVLSFISYKMNLPSLAIVPAIGFFVLGFELYTASQDLLVLGLFYLVAVVQFVLAFGRRD